MAGGAPTSAASTQALSLQGDTLGLSDRAGCRRHNATGEPEFAELRSSSPLQARALKASPDVSGAGEERCCGRADPGNLPRRVTALAPRLALRKPAPWCSARLCRSKAGREPTDQQQQRRLVLRDALSVKAGEDWSVFSSRQGVFHFY